MVLYTADVMQRGQVVRCTTAYANSPEEARDNILARNPLKPGEILKVNHWNGEPALEVAAPREVMRDELTVEVPVFRRPRDYSRMRLT